MFLNFYGLKVQPFGVTPDPEFLYLGTSHREALASAAYGIQSGVGFGAVIAKPGMGKTTLLFALLRHFQNSAQSAFLFDTQCNSKDLLQNLLAEFKLQPEDGKSDASALTCLRRFLLKSARANQRVLVVVDEAQNLDIPVFETLRLLSNFETPQAKLLHIVLAGQPELGRKLALPELEQLRQRITIVSRLDAFAPADVVRYVAHRLKRAGYHGGSLFTPEALGILVEKSHGIPREINRLCFNAMSLGCAMGKSLIDGQVVREAAADLEFGFVPKPEETAHRVEAAGTNEGLAALFAAALEAPAPAKEEAEQEQKQKLQPMESVSPVDRESERRPQVAPKPVPVKPKAELEKPAASAPKTGLGEVETVRAFRAATASQRDVQSKRLGFRRFAWLWGLTFVAALAFGVSIWLSDLHGATALASQVVSATERSVWQRLGSLKPGSATEKKEQKDLPKLNSGDLESGSGTSPAHKIKPDSPVATAHNTHDRSLPAPSAAASTNSATTVTQRSRNQKKVQTTGLPVKRAASTGNNVPTTPNDVALAGPARSHFVVFEAANHPAPEKTLAAKLVKRVDPVYPQLATGSGGSGEVVLTAHVDEAGKVQAVKPISGDPVLVRSAIDAVRQWEYQPSLVNGQPRQSDERVEITFSPR